jgi:sigma-E factor negative regulatory protein RseB
MRLNNKSMLRLLSIVIAIALSTSLAMAKSEPEALQLLERMGNAAKQLNYDGVFTYQSGQKLQAIRIIHKSGKDGEVERLLSLNGAARELIRTDDLVTCIIPEGNQVNINRRPFGQGFPNKLLRRINSATPYYNIMMGKKGRVADRKAQQLIVNPKDNYRYGYHLWIDEEKALLLQSDLLTESGEVVEKFAFSSIKMDIPIPDEALAPQMSGEQLTWNRIETVDPKQIEHEVSEWRINWLPDGFVLVAQQHRQKANNKKLVEQRVYSDGLSSVSIFIEKSSEKNRHLKGLSNMGAVNAFGMELDGHFVTVVGQAPQITIEKIGQAIKFEGRSVD